MTELPQGTQVLRSSAYGTSLWTRTARVTTLLDGEKKEYFLKVRERYIELKLKFLTNSGSVLQNQVLR